jgi:hypothetical protein
LLRALTEPSGEHEPLLRSIVVKFVGHNKGTKFGELLKLLIKDGAEEEGELLFEVIRRLLLLELIFEIFIEKISI